MAVFWRIDRVMDKDAIQIINALGGVTETARLLHAPVTTVFAWKKNGIPQSRMAHIRLAAEAAGKALEHD